MITYLSAQETLLAKRAIVADSIGFTDWGGSAGGPIWKNHTFIFGDFEYYVLERFGSDQSRRGNGATHPNGDCERLGKLRP